MEHGALHRKSVPVDHGALELARKLREPGTREREAVERVVGHLPAKLSEAQALASLMEVARRSVEDQVVSAGYTAYAAALDQEDLEFRSASRARRADRARVRVETGRE